MKKQLQLFKREKLEFGGSLLVGKRRERRNLSQKCAIHMMLKAKFGNLREHKKLIDEQIEKWAKEFNIRTYGHSVQSDHVHFNMRISTVENYKKFIRALTGRLAQLLKIEFKYRPFTKLIRCGRQFKNLVNYIIQNENEVTGRIPYKPRGRKVLRI